MKITQLFAVILFAVSFLACAGTEKFQSRSNGQSENQPANSSDAAPKNEVGGGNRQQSAAQVSLTEAEQSKTAPTAIERKIIRNADLTLEADVPEESLQKITAIAESRGGFVIESQASSSSSDVTKRDIVTLTVRVPAEKFTESLEEIRKVSNRVVLENIKGQDVTEEFVDVEARLKTKKALEEQFLEIMKQSKTVADTLNVQKELATVRGEIEQIEGRKRFLENQTSLSTIKIRLQTPTAFANSSGFFYQLKQSFSSGFSGAMSFVLFFVSAIIALLPFFILVVLPIYLLIRYLLKKRKKQKAASEIAREEIKNE